MKVQIKDETGRVKSVVIQDEARYRQWASYVRANPAVFGDAAEPVAFSISQLAYMEQKSFARLYNPLHYEQLLAGCIDYSAGPAARSVIYRITDGAGIGQRIAPSTSNVPMVDVAVQLQTIAVASGGIGYDFTQEDVDVSGMLPWNIIESKQVQAILSYKRHMNNVALTGELNFTGMYNNALATAAQKASGTFAGFPWSAATADTIVADIIDGYSSFRQATGSNFNPTKLILPLSSRMLLYKPRASFSDVTIEKFITDSLKIEISDDPLLETLGTVGGAKRAVFANTDNDNMVFHVPMPIMFMAPQITGFRTIVPARYRYAGLELRRPQAIRYMDGM